jgi:hypothetical protein
MGHFSELYENLTKELLSEQEGQKSVDVMPDAPPDIDNVDQPVEDQTQDLKPDQLSALDEVEEDSMKVDWVKKIIRLLSLLNREDENVQRLISDLSSGSVNADTLKNKESQIEELIRTIPTEKNI